MTMQTRNGGFLSVIGGCACVAAFVCGCAAVPSLPPWQNISAEREARKQETLQHIDRTRGRAAEVEQAAFAKEPASDAVVPPSRTADRLPGAEAIGAAVDPNLVPTATTPSPEQMLRADADQAVALGDLEEAIGLYRQLIATQPNDAELHHALALVAEQMDLHEEASRHYLEAMRLAPNEQLYRLCFEAHADLLASEPAISPVVR
jgi:Flp pilus assembly protein TadD